MAQQGPTPLWLSLPETPSLLRSYLPKNLNDQFLVFGPNNAIYLQSCHSVTLSLISSKYRVITKCLSENDFGLGLKTLHTECKPLQTYHHNDFQPKQDRLRACTVASVALSLKKLQSKRESLSSPMDATSSCLPYRMRLIHKDKISERVVRKLSSEARRMKGNA